jgi:hypothetical protein
MITAKANAVTIPPSIMCRADDAIKECCERAWKVGCWPITADCDFR